MTDLLPQFGSWGQTILAFVVALSIIVAIHELGHLMVGRWTGIRAEVFSVGFGPVLFSRTDRHGTRWQLAALPLGGFVKFWGDANAASVGGDPTRVDPALRRHTMLGAPLWARALTVAAGPLANFLLAILVFAGVFMLQGRPAEPLTIAAIAPLPDAYASDLRPGDRIVAIAGTRLDGATLPELTAESEPRVVYVVERDGQEIEVAAPWPFPPIVGSVNFDKPAAAAGVEPGDVILAVDGREVWDFQQVYEAVGGSEGRPIALTLWRAGETLEMEIAPEQSDVLDAEGAFETRWVLGITPGNVFEPQLATPGPLRALADGATQLWFVLTTSLVGLGHMITGSISTCAISGPVGIAQASGAMAALGPIDFLWFIGIISAGVGLMNLFPIPVLDGGHLVFHAYEAVARRPPGDRALRVLMAAGLAVILALTLFGVLNDVLLCP